MERKLFGYAGQAMHFDLSPIPSPILRLALAALILAGCSQLRSESAAGPVGCPSVAVVGTEPAGSDPDFTRYGFSRVAAVGRFVPGQTTTVSAGGISITLPADFHTEQLDFELLLGNAADWQPCVGSDRVVVAPYAYRVRESATGKAVGRFDNPVRAAITDPRIDSSSTYWITTAESPPTVEPSSNPHAIEGTTYVTANTAARRGWFLTVPRR